MEHIIMLWNFVDLMCWETVRNHRSAHTDMFSLKTRPFKFARVAL